jgi:hypothetical protein
VIPPEAGRLLVQSRVLPSGPTVVDTLANVAFAYGLLVGLTAQETPLWTLMSFDAAEQNFYRGARAGLDGALWWPGRGEAPVVDLVLTTLLPLAHKGLDRAGISPRSRDRLLGIIQRRCELRRNGATWQRDTARALAAVGHDRWSALGVMTARYAQLSLSDLPVHEWPLTGPV